MRNVTAETLLDLARQALPGELSRLHAAGENFDEYVYVMNNAAVSPGIGLLIQALLAAGRSTEGARAEAAKLAEEATSKGQPFTAGGTYSRKEFAAQISEGHGGEDLVAWLLEPVPAGHFGIIAVNGSELLWELVEIAPRSKPN